MLAALVALLAVAQPAAFDAFEHRRAAGPAAIDAEIAGLRERWRNGLDADAGARLARLLLARDATDAADYRRDAAALEAFRVELARRNRTVLESWEYPTEWLNRRWLNGAVSARDADARELLRRVFADQSTLMAEPPEPLGEAANVIAMTEARRLGRANSTWLKSVLARIGWFDIGTYGAEASQAAWLIVQHADHDPEWQAAVLADLAPRVARGDMQPNYYAYLVDRVAVNGGRPQVYGTQGECAGPGDWQPKATIAPEQIDARRAEVGLGPIAEYRARFTCG
jgi:hypothetical protein